MSEFDSEKDFLDVIVKRFVESSVESETAIEPRYKNIVDWVVRGLGVGSLYVYKRQLQVLVEFFGLLCERCNKKLLEKVNGDLWFCDERELRNLVLRELNYEKEVLECPICDSVVERMPYKELVLCVGMRSGKTTTAAMIASWVFYLSLVWKNLDKKFGLIPDQRLRYSMVATAERQSEKTVWSSFKSLLFNVVDMDIKGLVNRSDGRNKELRRKFNVNTEKETEWNIGLIDYFSLPSNSNSLAGGTGVGMVLEEYARFVLSDSYRSAQEVYAVLERSLKTVRSLSKTYVDDMFGLAIVIGSPYHYGNDPIVELVYGVGYDDGALKYGKYVDSVSKRLSYHYPTWLFNPVLPEGAFESEKKNNYELFLRDYGAMPVRSETRFFAKDIVDACVIRGKPLLEFVETFKKVGNVSLKTAIVNVKPEFFEYNYAVHVDLGESKDLLTMAFARSDAGGDIIIVDGLLVLKPESGVRVYIDTPVDVLRVLKGYMNIGIVSFDKWQSISGMQRLSELGFRVGRRSVGDNEFQLFRNMMFNDAVKIVVKENSVIENVLMGEFRDVRLGKNGKLTHTDLLCSIVGAVLNAREPFGVKTYFGAAEMGNVKDYAKITPVVIRGRW